MQDIHFIVTAEVLDLGVKIATARISGLNNTPENADFEQYKNTELEQIRQQWTGKSYKDDPILTGFRDLHSRVGRSNRDYVASPEALRKLFLEKGRFPHINTVVDIYNLVSLQSGLALGAHDMGKVQGNITLRLTNGTETFIPLGTNEPVKIFPGEYSYIDDGNNVICRMEVLQVEPTKVTLETQDIFLIIQGNTVTEDKYVQTVAEEVCRLITRFCGGTFTFLRESSPWPPVFS